MNSLQSKLGDLIEVVRTLDPGCDLSNVKKEIVDLLNKALVSDKLTPEKLFAAVEKSKELKLNLPSLEFYYSWAVREKGMKEEQLDRANQLIRTARLGYPHKFDDLELDELKPEDLKNRIDLKSHICALAAEDGNLKILQFAHEQGYPWDENTTKFAALNGHLHCLEYAFLHGCPSDEDTCNYAALNGEFECLKFAHENKFELGYFTCAMAAAGGDLVCLIYSLQQKSQSHLLSFELAAEYGHLHILKYIKYLKLEPDSSYACEAAAKNGHLDCLRFISENHYHFNPYVFILAAKYGHMACYDYARKLCLD